MATSIISSRSRRNSTGETNSSNSRENFLPPRYLRASIGSCHDLCKYGGKDSSEVEERRPFPKRTVIEGGVQSERKKKTDVFICKTSPNCVNHISKHDFKVKSADGKKSVMMPRISLDSKRAPLKAKEEHKLKQTPSPRDFSGVFGSGSPSHGDLFSVRTSLSKVSRLNLQKKRTVKAFLPPTNVNKARKSDPELVEEKTLYVISTEAESKFPDSFLAITHANEPFPFPSALVRSLSVPNTVSSLSDIIVNQKETEYMVTKEDGHSLHIKESGDVGVECMVSCESNHYDPVTTLQMGKSVQVQTDKFDRQGRVFEDNQNMKFNSQISFKRRVVDADKNDGESDSEKVVLRHQDVQGKKDGQGLYNNIIKETANKLVETQKSKVKALVGAFETVISLQ